MIEFKTKGPIWERRIRVMEDGDGGLMICQGKKFAGTRERYADARVWLTIQELEVIAGKYLKKGGKKTCQELLKSAS